MKWTLDDVDERHTAHPDTFEVIPLEDRQALPLGMDTKLIFDWPDGGERMWVRITARLELPSGVTYRGELLNTPALHNDLLSGTLIAFGPQHVADAMWPDQDEPPLGQGTA